MSNTNGAKQTKRKYLALAVDDDEAFLQSLEHVLPKRLAGRHPEFECDFEFCPGPESTLRLLQEIQPHEGPVALIISDQKMPTMPGTKLIETVKQRCDGICCMLLTGYAGLDSARYAINHQLLDQYVSKPIEDMEAFTALVFNLVERFHLKMTKQEKAEEAAKNLRQIQLASQAVARMKTVAEGVAGMNQGLKNLDLDDVLDIGIQQIPELMGADNACFMLPDARGRLSIVRRCGDKLCCDEPGKRPALGPDGILLDGKVNQYERLLLVQFPVPAPGGGKGSAASPQRRGVVCLSMRRPKMPDKELEYAALLIRDIFGANVASAMRFAASREELRIDGLTGLCRRDVFVEALDVACYAANRYARPLSVALIDVDKLKGINEEAGRAAGDAVLSLIGQLFKRGFRKSDIAARYGGDEFAVLMPETASHAAAIALERMRVAALAVPSVGAQKATLSIGVASFKPGETPADLLRRTDLVLRDAKQQGGNRLCVGEVAEEGRSLAHASSLTRS